MGLFEPPPSQTPTPRSAGLTIWHLLIGVLVLLGGLVGFGYYRSGGRTTPVASSSLAPEPPRREAARQVEAQETLTSFLEACRLSDTKKVLSLLPNAEGYPIVFSHKVLRGDGCVVEVGDIQATRTGWEQLEPAAKSISSDIALRESIPEWKSMPVTLSDEQKALLEKHQALFTVASGRYGRSVFPDNAFSGSGNYSIEACSFVTDIELTNKLGMRLWKKRTFVVARTNVASVITKTGWFISGWTDAGE